MRLLVDAARRAGDIALQFFGQDPETWDKGDAGPVTEADLAIDAMLRDTLSSARPDYGWLSEESEDDAARLDRQTVFICDPIDGTRAFIEGGKSFAHSLAVARDGVVTAAAVFLPVPGKMYAAALGSGARLNDQPLSAQANTPLQDAEILTTKQNLDPRHWPKGVPTFKRAYRPSLAYRMSLAGEGRFAAMMTLRPTWEWDIAAGTLIVTEAGGVVTDGWGQPLRFNNATPKLDGVIAGGQRVHGELMAYRHGTEPGC